MQLLIRVCIQKHWNNVVLFFCLPKSVRSHHSKRKLINLVDHCPEKYCVSHFSFLQVIMAQAWKALALMSIPWRIQTVNNEELFDNWPDPVIPIEASSLRVTGLPLSFLSMNGCNLNLDQKPLLSVSASPEVDQSYVQFTLGGGVLGSL